MTVGKTVPYFSLILLGQRYALLPCSSFAFFMLFRVIFLVVLGGGSIVVGDAAAAVL